MLMKTNFKRITKLSSDSVPVLKNKMQIERAVSLLFAYENTGYTPSEIMELKETIYNLQQRVKKLEDWT